MVLQSSKAPEHCGPNSTLCNTSAIPLPHSLAHHHLNLQYNLQYHKLCSSAQHEVANVECKVVSINLATTANDKPDFWWEGPWLAAQQILPVVNDAV